MMGTDLTHVGTAALAAEYDAIYALLDPTAEQDDTASAIIETLDDGGIDLVAFYQAAEAQPELTMLQWCINNGLCDGPPEHADYPHEPGRLYDCYACEHGACTCAEGDAPCMSLYCVNPDKDEL
jgi:hypothetical protein